jgi:hypothetical protein
MYEMLIPTLATGSLPEDCYLLQGRLTSAVNPGA